MENVGSKYIKIKMEIQSGSIVKVRDEKERDGIEVGQQELREVLRHPNTRRVGEIFHSHMSPGCIYVVIGGWVRKICS